MNKTKTITFYADPGHAWAKAKRSELVKLGIDQQISGYSYQRGEFAYLEEDLDAGIYIKALKEQGYEIKFKECHSNKRSKIRGYDCYRK